MSHPKRWELECFSAALGIGWCCDVIEPQTDVPQFTTWAWTEAKARQKAHEWTMRRRLIELTEKTAHA